MSHLCECENQYDHDLQPCPALRDLYRAGLIAGRVEALDRAAALLIHNASADMVHPGRALSEDGQHYVDRIGEELRKELLSSEPNYESRVDDLKDQLAMMRQQRNLLQSAAQDVWDRYFCGPVQTLAGGEAEFSDAIWTLGKLLPLEPTLQK